MPKKFFGYTGSFCTTTKNNLQCGQRQKPAHPHQLTLLQLDQKGRIIGSLRVEKVAPVLRSQPLDHVTRSLPFGHNARTAPGVAPPEAVRLAEKERIMIDSTRPPLAPLSAEARAVIARVVDEAPPLSDELAERIARLLNGAEVSP